MICKLNKFLFLSVLLLLIITLSGCMGDKAYRQAELTEHALSIDVAKNADYVLISHSKGYVDLASFNNLKFKKIAQWALEESADAGVIASDFSDDNQFVATVSQKTIARYSLKNKKIDQYWSLDNITNVKLSANGEFALVAAAEKKDDKYGKYLHYRMVYFHLPTGKIQYAFYHDDVVSTIDLSSDGRYAISGSDNGNAKLWDLKEGLLLYTWKHPSKLHKVALSADGQYAMTNNSAGEIKIYKTKNGKLHQKLKLPKASVSAAVFSEDSRFLATGLSRETLILWRVKTGKVIKKWYPKRRYFWQSSLARVTSLAFYKNKKLVSVTSRGIAQMWKF